MLALQHSKLEPNSDLPAPLVRLFREMAKLELLASQIGDSLIL